MTVKVKGKGQGIGFWDFAQNDVLVQDDGQGQGLGSRDWILGLRPE
jgi:hypothetical protein